MCRASIQYVLLGEQTKNAYLGYRSRRHRRRPGALGGEVQCKWCWLVAVRPPRYDVVAMRAAIEKIAGFAGWYSVARGEAPPTGARFSSQNAVIGCAFTRELEPEEMELVCDFLAATRPADKSYLWDGSQPGWKLVEDRDCEVLIELGAELGSLDPKRQDALHDALGAARYNGLSSFQSSIRLRYFDAAAAAEREAAALRCAGFDVQVIERPSYLITRNTAAGSSVLLVEDEQQLDDIVRCMIAAGVPVERRGG